MSEKQIQSTTQEEATPSENPTPEDERFSAAERVILPVALATQVLNDAAHTADGVVDMAMGNVKRGGSTFLGSIGRILASPVNLISGIVVGKPAIKIPHSFEHNADGSTEGTLVTNTLINTTEAAGDVVEGTVDIALSPLHLAEGVDAFTEQVSKGGKKLVQAPQTLVGVKEANSTLKNNAEKDITHEDLAYEEKTPPQPDNQR